MKRLGIVLSILTAVTFLICGTALAYSAAIKPVEAPKIVHLSADVIFDKVNDERLKNGLQPLIRDSRLDASAKAKANDMAKYQYNAHKNPITDKSGYTYVIDFAPSLCTFASENLSWDYTSEQLAILGWIGSKPHHDAILDSRYTLTGVAVTGSKVVQHFCAQ